MLYTLSTAHRDIDRKYMIVIFLRHSHVSVNDEFVSAVRFVVKEQVVVRVSPGMSVRE